MKREGYGSTSSSSNQATAAPSRNKKDTNLSTQSQSTSSSNIRRNISAQSARSAALTVDTESLLGENLLLSGSPAPNERGTGGGGDNVDLKSMFLSPTASESDVPSIIEQDEESVHEVDIETSNNNDDKENNMQMPQDTPKRTGASPRKHISRGSLHSGTNGSSDPALIGLNVITNELDTLAYSRDPDESTLLTNDNFTKRYLSSLDEEGRRRGLFWWIFKSHQESYADDPPYMLVCLGLAVGICLCSIAALAYVEYNHHMGRTIISTTDQNATSSSSSSSEGTWHGVPYTQIGRESFSDPVSNIMDVSLFHPSLLYDQHVSPSDGNTRRRLASSPKRFLKVPFPTGSFWTNLVLLPQKKQETKSNQFSYPIVAYPYAYQWSKLGKLQASYSATRRVVKDKGIQDAFAPDISFGSIQEIHTRHIVRFDSLSVTLRFYAGTSSTDGNWETYIVQGSPYITAKYIGLAPELSALSDFVDIECPPPFNEVSVSILPLPKPQHRRMTASSSSTTSATPGKKLGICAITTDSTKHEKIITGVQFVVTTKEGLTMLVFASEPITFKFNQAARRSIQSTNRYSGVIRVAIIPPPSSSSSSSSSTTAKSMDIKELATSTGVKRLIYHAGAYPTEGSVSWDFISGTRHPLATTKSTHTNSFNKGRRRLSAGEQQKKTENNIGRITFAFKTSRMTSSSPGTSVPLLMLALPHHAASISFAEELLLHKDSFDLTYQSIKGDMTPVTGNIWTCEEELTFLGFGDETLSAKTNIAQQAQESSTSSHSAAKTSATSQRPIIHESTAISTLDQSIRDLIISNVESDLNINLPVISNGAYGFGKQIARIAQLAHVAEVVDAANNKEIDEIVSQIKNTTKTATSSSSSNPGSSTTARKAYALLEKYLIMWLVGDENDKRLVYDAQLGGILSKEGMKDVVNSDFGNARYNDHHFHYGYVLYASAILGRANPKFISQYGPFVDALFYDVANNGADAKQTSVGKEIFFPLARHKSWFDGHSFASGLFPFADGKSQESSSEAINCYFGAYLWARVRWGSSSSSMVDYTRLLLATEMTGAKTYWHMTAPTQGKKSAATSSSGSSNATLPSNKGPSLIPIAYDAEFRKNYMVGNLGMTDVTSTTWFGNDNIYVHLINFMPVTAITSELFDKGYVKGERTVLSENDSVENAWRGYSICNEAIIDPNAAWLEAQNLISTQLDPGLSKSQVLFWVSTREGFSSSTTVEVSNSDSDVMSGGDIDGGSEATPEQDGTSSSSSIKNTADTASKPANAQSTSLARCTSHEKCVAEGLLGVCCPTNEGVFLHCCS